MKIGVVGYGSIGQRHYEILVELGHEVTVVSRRSLNVPSIGYNELHEACHEWVTK